jgi:hypothetical protein
MTTIAYRDGVMAGDSGNNFSNVIYRSALKVARGPDGSLHGITGGAGEAGEYLRWVIAGMVGDPPKPEATNPQEGRSSFVVLIALPSGLVRLWTAYGMEDHHNIPFMAAGAGSEIAIGAMAAGASAERAVEIVAEYSSYAALPVVTVKR